MALREALFRLVDGHDLIPQEVTDAIDEIVAGGAPASLVGGFLVALRMKGETPEEIAAFARAMRAHAVAVTPTTTGLVDTCGTGGDGSGTMNISTAAAFVVAGTGLPVAKHGNVALTSRSGSADVLGALGVRLDLDAGQVAACIDRAGIGFIFARAFHPAMAAVMPIRRELGVRTSFNILGPLTNPARPSYQLVGVANAGLADLVARALAEMGTERALVVHGAGGCDELTLEDDNLVLRVEDGTINRHTVSPADVGLPKAPLLSLQGGSPEENAKRLRAILDGDTGPLRDCVVFNAAAAIVAAGTAADLREGVAIAAGTIDSGAASAALDRLLDVVRSFPS